MSFLTYTSHPVLFASSVGGVTLGVTLLLLPWKQISFGDSWSNSFLSSSSTRINSLNSKVLSEQERSCSVNLGFEEFINRFLDPRDYIAISCDNKGKGNDGILEDSWDALFPIELFKGSKDELIKDPKFSMRTWTRIEEEVGGEQELFFRTKFLSDKLLQKEIIGIWKYDDLYITKDKKVDIVTPKETYMSKKIYFVHDTGRR